MEGRKTLQEVILGYKKPLDRSDRFKIDLRRHYTLISDTDFTDSIETLSKELKLPKLKPSTDLFSKKVVVQKDRFMSVNSKYINSLSEDQKDLIEKKIYEKILIKFKLNFNFYPLVEFLLLYGFFPVEPYTFHIMPNRNMHNLYFRYLREFIRTPHTTSDIKQFIKEAKLKYGIYSKPTTKERKHLNNIVSVLKYNKNKERSDKNIENFFTDFNSIKEKINAEDFIVESNSFTKRTMNQIAFYQLTSEATEDEINKNMRRLYAFNKRLKNKDII